MKMYAPIDVLLFCMSIGVWLAKRSGLMDLILRAIESSLLTFLAMFFLYNMAKRSGLMDLLLRAIESSPML